MANPQLIQYLKTQEAQGYTPAQLKQVLLQQGYKPEEVDEAISAAGAGVPAQSSSTSPPQSGGIKKRNPFLVFLFVFITFGFYGLYWWVSTTKELQRNTKSAPSLLFFFIPFLLIPVMTISGFVAGILGISAQDIMIIPIGFSIIALFCSAFFFWKYCKAINELTGFSSIVLFLLWFFMSPIALIIAQMQLNKKATT
ncbi:DUF4234 domain-containing protein [Nanoarchaeota archaeon]